MQKKSGSTDGNVRHNLADESLRDRQDTEDIPIKLRVGFRRFRNFSIKLGQFHLITVDRKFQTN